MFQINIFIYFSNYR